MYPCTPISFKIGITNILLASCNACNIKMWLRQQFFTYWKYKNIPDIKKQTEQTRKQTDMIDFCEFSSLFLKSPSDVTSINMYVTLMITINQVQVWMNYDVQKQLSRGVLSKRCSENMQKIYRRTPMPKCDFNKFRIPFTRNTSERLLLDVECLPKRNWGEIVYHQL